ncbi:hypothetical protein SUGI_0859840 [Cryptomeria japonica]|nr:hypothetical protein SUGI_0859840 [Cryptomeria japonica]
MDDIEEGSKDKEWKIALQQWPPGNELPAPLVASNDTRGRLCEEEKEMDACTSHHHFRAYAQNGRQIDYSSGCRYKN